MKVFSAAHGHRQDLSRYTKQHHAAVHRAQKSHRVVPVSFRCLEAVKYRLQ